MLGQTFAPLFDPSQKQQAGGPQGQTGAQQAIQTLNTRLPRFSGGQLPAPMALLTSPGSAGLPSGISPIIEAILRSVLGPGMGAGQAAAPSAPSGFMGGSGGSSPAPLPLPAVHYQPPPGGTAGPNPTDTTREDRENRRGKMGTDTFMNNY